jgi:hypothetical protein
MTIQAVAAMRFEAHLMAGGSFISARAGAGVALSLEFAKNLLGSKVEKSI